ncbi:HYR domain-containing protein, partial [Flavobacterium flavipallidum]
MKTTLPTNRLLFFVFFIANLLFVNTSFGQIVMLDQADLDYAPGETVYITGTGWHPGETVLLEVENLTNPTVDCGPVTPPPHETWTTVADENGNFTASWYVNDCELGADLLLGALGSSSGFSYEIFFTDGNSVTFNNPTQNGTVNTGVGGVVTYNFNVTRDNGNNDFTTTLTAIGLPTGVSASFSPNPLNFPKIQNHSLPTTLSLTVASSVPAGVYLFSVSGSGGGTSGDIALTVGGCNTPTISASNLPASGVINNTTNTCGASITLGANLTITGTPAPTVTYSLSNFGATISNPYVFPIGTTKVWAKASNSCGEAITSFTVTVSDTEAPAIICPGNIVQSTDTGLCSAVVTYVAPVGTDNCSGQSTVQTAGLPSGSAFPKGKTTNTFEVTDASGNKTSCSFDITINDTEAPAIICPGNIVQSTDTGLCSAVVTYVAPVGTDNCSGQSTVQTAGLP